MCRPAFAPHRLEAVITPVDSRVLAEWCLAELPRRWRHVQLTKSFTGAEVNIRILEAHARAQKQLVENLNQQIQTQMAVLAANQASVGAAVSKMAETQEQQGLFESVKRIFDLIGITGGGNSGAIDAAQAMVDYQKETVD